MASSDAENGDARADVEDQRAAGFCNDATGLPALPAHLNALRQALVEWAEVGEPDNDDVVAMLRLASAAKLKKRAEYDGVSWDARDIARACRFHWRRLAARRLAWTWRRSEGAADGFPPSVDAALRGITRDEWAADVGDVGDEQHASKKRRLGG